MHFVLYTKDILHVYGLSTLLTLGIFVGSLYGCVRLFVDAIGFAARTFPDHVRPIGPVRTQGKRPSDEPPDRE